MKVLIVDDIETNRKLLRVNLEVEGIETVEAGDGVQALTALEGGGVDAIISDILMPQMDGYRFCREVRKREELSEAPFIFYTSTYTSPSDEQLALNCGADRYIKKPAHISVILEALRTLSAPDASRPRSPAPVEEALIMREYNEALVRKLEDRNAELERAREEIARANEVLELRVQERTAELTAANQELEAFSHSLAHDLRSPLMAVDGFSHILLEECAGKVDESAMGHLRFIARAAARMNELIDDLLRLATASRAAMSRERIDLSVMVQAIVQDLGALEPERHVRLAVAHGITVCADKALLRIALENLLSNAWKFTRKTQNARIEFGVTDGDGERVYFVRDNGAGFEMSQAHRLFQAFARLHAFSDFAGIGIGLTTVQRVVRRNGGTISAQGIKGAGATMSFTLGEESYE